MLDDFTKGFMLADARDMLDRSNYTQLYQGQRKKTYYMKPTTWKFLRYSHSYRLRIFRWSYTSTLVLGFEVIDSGDKRYSTIIAPA